MGTLAIIIGILHGILAVAIVAVVLLQSGKAAGLSGSIAGGAETFFGKNKGRTIDSLLSKYTTYIAIGFMVTSIMLYLLLK